MKKWLLMTVVVLGTVSRGWAIPPVGPPGDEPAAGAPAAEALAAEAPAAGAAQPSGPAIELLKDVDLKADAIPQRPGRPTQPTVVRSAEDAAGLFTESAAAALKKQVDFSQQIVLVFAWQGSGQDRLEYDVSASLPNEVVRRPPQIVFSYQPGRTRDLRPHTRVYAVRSDALWSVGVSWKQAQEILRTEKIQSVMQTHSRHVTIMLEDGTRVETIEPGLDDVISFLEKLNKNIPIATE